MRARWVLLCLLFGCGATAPTSSTISVAPTEPTPAELQAELEAFARLFPHAVQPERDVINIGGGYRPRALRDVALRGHRIVAALKPLEVLIRNGDQWQSVPLQDELQWPSFLALRGDQLFVIGSHEEHLRVCRVEDGALRNCRSGPSLVYEQTPINGEMRNVMLTFVAHAHDAARSYVLAYGRDNHTLYVIEDHGIDEIPLTGLSSSEFVSAMRAESDGRVRFATSNGAVFEWSRNQALRRIDDGSLTREREALGSDAAVTPISMIVTSSGFLSSWPRMRFDGSSWRTAASENTCTRQQDEDYVCGDTAFSAAAGTNGEGIFHVVRDADRGKVGYVLAVPFDTSAFSHAAGSVSFVWEGLAEHASGWIGLRFVVPSGVTLAATSGGRFDPSAHASPANIAALRTRFEAGLEESARPRAQLLAVWFASERAEIERSASAELLECLSEASEHFTHDSRPMGPFPTWRPMFLHDPAAAQYANYSLRQCGEAAEASNAEQIP